MPARLFNEARHPADRKVTGDLVSTSPNDLRAVGVCSWWVVERRAGARTVTSRLQDRSTAVYGRPWRYESRVDTWEGFPPDDRGRPRTRRELRRGPRSGRFVATTR